MVVTAKQLRLQTSKILKTVQRAGSVTVTLRGKPVAKNLFAGREEAREGSAGISCYRNVGRPTRYERSQCLGQKNSQTSLPTTLIFDSDVVIWMLRGHPKAVRFARTIDPAERNVSVVSYLEVLRGCRNRLEANDFREFMEEWFTEVVPLKPEIGDSAVSLMAQFALSHRPGVDDMLIAATALDRKETVATGNLKHFDFIPGLVVQRFQV